MRARVLVCLCACFVALLFSVLAAMPARPAPLRASIAVADGSQLWLGGVVRFDTTAPKSVRNPRVEVLCYQNAELVYAGAGDAADDFLLGGGASQWVTNGGPAECVANLFWWGRNAGVQTYNPLASVQFDAAGGQVGTATAGPAVPFEGN